MATRYELPPETLSKPTVSFRVSLPRSECYYGRVALSMLECQLDMLEFALSARDINARTTPNQSPGIVFGRVDAHPHRQFITTTSFA